MKKTLCLLSAVLCCTLFASAAITGVTNAGAGSAVRAIAGGEVVAETTVTWKNDYTLRAVEGTVDIVISAPGALDYTFLGVNDDRWDVELPAAVLLFGDVNGDNMVNIMDMGAFRADFGKTGESITNPLTDINGDNMVNIMDMGTFRANFGKTAAKDTTVRAAYRPGTPVVYLETGDEYAEGVEAALSVAGNTERRFVTNPEVFTTPGSLYWAVADKEGIVTVTPMTGEDEWVILGEITYVDGDYLELGDMELELTEDCVLYQVNKAGTRVTEGTLKVGKTAVAVRRYTGGEVYQIYQYSGDFLGW